MLKTLGFTDGAILGMVLAESLRLAGLGGGLGLLLGVADDPVRGDPTSGFLPVFYFPPRDLALGVAAGAGARPGARPAAGPAGHAAAHRRCAAEG